jgi:hypothetical protein
MIHRICIVFAAFCLISFCSRIQAEIITIDGTVKSVDATKRTITVETGTKEMTLDVGSKAKISIDGEDSGLDGLKEGRTVRLSYHDQLEVVVKIEAMLSETLVNLTELNGPSNDGAPWVSSDGLRIYWTAADENVRGKHYILAARRDSPLSPFVDKKRLFEGHGPVLSKDELQMYFRSLEGDFINLSTRTSTSEAFGPPVAVKSLTFVRLDPAPRWLTDDGLTMYLDMIEPQENNQHFTWEVQRDRITSDWGSPRRTRVAVPGMPQDFRFTQVSASPDNLHLLCPAVGTKAGTRFFRVGVLSRSATDQPFVKWRELELERAGRYSRCLKPLFVSKTNELFLVSSELHANDQDRQTRKEDIWVVKGFPSPY